MPGHARNPGVPLDLAWVGESRVNLPATIRRAAAHPGRRSVKKAYQAAWLLRALTCTDLTTLAGDDTSINVERLCAKAKSPIRKDIIKALGVEGKNIQCGAVCV
jgi:deoxyribose-phosphate aldolase